MSKSSLLMIGNYLSSPRHNRNIWHDLAEKLEQAGWKVTTTSVKENQVLRLLEMLTTILHKRKDYAIAQIDVFSGTAFIFAEFCTRLLRILKKPIILTLHGGRLPEFAAKQPERVRRLLGFADLCVTPSPFLQTELAAFKPGIRLIPNPVELSSIAYRERTRAEARLVWIRAFHETYNPSLVIHVLQLVMERYPSVILTMIGPDKGDGSLEKSIALAEKLGVQGHLTLVPGVPHDEVSKYLQKNDIFINSTNYDTAPRSVIEAMAAGLCVVSTDVGGIPWLLSDQENGLLVASNDAELMAKAILRVLDEPALAASLSKGAYQKARMYNWETVLPMWEALFQEILGQQT